MRHLTRVIRNQKGNTLVLFSVIISALAVVAMSAVGFAKYDVARTNVQSAFDNALLSAVALTITDPVNHPCTSLGSSVTTFFRNNIPNNAGITIVYVTAAPAGTCASPSSPPTWTGSIKVKLSNFSGLEITSSNFTVSSTVQWGGLKKAEVVFTLNTSTSMCLQENYTSSGTSNFYTFSPYADHKCDKLDMVATAMSDIITNGLAPITLSGEAVYKVGVVPFNHKVLLPNVNAVLNPTSTNCPTPTVANTQATSGTTLVYVNPDANCYVPPASAVGLVIPPQLATVEATASSGWTNNEGKSKGTTYYTDFSDAMPLAGVQPLTPITAASKTSLNTYVQSIVAQTDQANTAGLGWVRSDIPVLTAALMLDPNTPNYASIFSGGATPAAFNDSNTRKIVVMMGDGTNVGCCYSAYPDTAADAALISSGYSGPLPNFANQYLFSYEVDNAALYQGSSDPNLSNFDAATLASYGVPSQSICDQLKAQGVTIYSVLVGVNSTDLGYNTIKQAYQNCASNPQYFFNIPSLTQGEVNSDYARTIRTIGQSFVQLRVVK